MSQISLSHQFSQRWSEAPKEVKGALVQELDDIVRLLDNNTALEDFKFAIPDLDAYIETVYANLATQQATMTPAPKDGKPQPMVTVDDTPQDITDNLADDDNAAITDEPTTFEVTPVDTKVDTKTGTISVSTPSPTSSKDTCVNTSLTPTTSAPIDASSPDLDLAAIRSKTVGSSVIIHALDANDNNDNNDKEALLSEQTVDTLKTLSEQQINESAQLSSDVPHRAIDDTLLKELEANIDDYLTERLTDISEDLKSWLRDQVKQHNQQAADDKQ